MATTKPLPAEFLLNRGYCCGNRCKNCPYVPNHTDARPQEKNAFKKTYNRKLLMEITEKNYEEISWMFEPEYGGFVHDTKNGEFVFVPNSKPLNGYKLEQITEIIRHFNQYGNG